MTQYLLLNGFEVKISTIMQKNQLQQKVLKKKDNNNL